MASRPRHGGRAAWGPEWWPHRDRSAGAVVAVRHRAGRVRRGMGVAAAAGTALMPGLWRRLMGGLLRSDAAGLADVERILLEADFGVAATRELLDAVRGTRNAERGTALERAVVALLGGATDGHALARAATPPTVILVFGVNGVGKTTTVAKLARRLGAEGRK